MPLTTLTPKWQNMHKHFKPSPLTNIHYYDKEKNQNKNITRSLLKYYSSILKKRKKIQLGKLLRKVKSICKAFHYVLTSLFRLIRFCFNHKISLTFLIFLLQTTCTFFYWNLTISCINILIIQKTFRSANFLTKYFFFLSRDAHSKDFLSIKLEELLIAFLNTKVKYFDSI